MIIGNIDTSARVLVVAEIGNNHEGSVDRARDLVKEAAACGVDAVKFQTFRTDHFVSASDAARYRRLKSFELSEAQFEELAGLARSLGLLFISTPLDLGSAAFLVRIVDAFKIASGDNNFYPLIARVAETGKPLIVSTGLADLEQVARTVAFVRSQWAARGVRGEMAILHCISSYPVPPEQANVSAVKVLAERCGCCVGYSDHTIGIEAAMLSVALGARVIEKHFTLDKHYSDFRDHQLSADPPEMRRLVEKVRLASTLLGTGVKAVQPCEAAGLQATRRSIVAGRDLPVGHRIVPEDLTWIRPGGGLEPGREGELVGRRLKRPVPFGEQIHPADVEASPASPKSGVCAG